MCSVVEWNKNIEQQHWQQIFNEPSKRNGFSIESQEFPNFLPHRIGKPPLRRVFPFFIDNQITKSIFLWARNAIVFSSSLNTLFGKYCHGGGCWLNDSLELLWALGELWRMRFFWLWLGSEGECSFARLRKKRALRKEQFKLPLINKTWSS